MYNVREMLESFSGGLNSLAQTNPSDVEKFMGLLGNTYRDDAVSTKTKELISIGISVYCRCEYCIVYHTYKALEAGCTKEELNEAAMVGVAFGGGPSMGYAVTLLRECIEEFSKDFENR